MLARIMEIVCDLDVKKILQFDEESKLGDEINQWLLKKCDITLQLF